MNYMMLPSDWSATFDALKRFTMLSTSSAVAAESFAALGASLRRLHRSHYNMRMSRRRPRYLPRWVNGRLRARDDR